MNSLRTTARLSSSRAKNRAFTPRKTTRARKQREKRDDDDGTRQRRRRDNPIALSLLQAIAVLLVFTLYYNHEPHFSNFSNDRSQPCPQKDRLVSIRKGAEGNDPVSLNFDMRWRGRTPDGPNTRQQQSQSCSFMLAYLLTGENDLAVV